MLKKIYVQIFCDETYDFITLHFFLTRQTLEYNTYPFCHSHITCYEILLFVYERIHSLLMSQHKIFEFWFCNVSW